MTDWSILGWVVLAGLAIAAIEAALFDWEQKVVDLLEFDTERL